MDNYEKPTVLATEDVSEGIYASSGATGGGTGSGSGGDCYTVTADIHQFPEVGRGDYRIQVDGVHAAGNGHHSGEQVLSLYFNQPVEYCWSNGTCIGGSGTSCIEIRYNYHNNATDNIGLGDVIVESDAGLAITGAELSCNYDCGQH